MLRVAVAGTPDTGYDGVVGAEAVRFNGFYYIGHVHYLYGLISRHTRAGARCMVLLSHPCSGFFRFARGLPSPDACILYTPYVLVQAATTRLKPLHADVDTYTVFIGSPSRER